MKSYFIIILMLMNGCQHSLESRRLEKYDIIGAIERGDLLDLGIQGIAIKIDTGAEGAALHAFAMEEFTRNDKAFIRFNTIIMKDHQEIIVSREAELLGTKIVRSSSGHSTKRPFIKSRLKIGQVVKEIEISLVDRSAMTYQMLLGRKNLEGFLVNPQENFLLSRDEN